MGLSWTFRTLNRPVLQKLAGAAAVMALERIPADIRAAGGVSRMSDPKMIKEIQEAVSIPVMAKVRIGHFVEAQILELLRLIISMRVKFYLQLTTVSMWIRKNSKFLLYVGLRTLEKLCVV